MFTTNYLSRYVVCSHVPSLTGRMFLAVDELIIHFCSHIYSHKDWVSRSCGSKSAHHHMPKIVDGRFLPVIVACYQSRKRDFDKPSHVTSPPTCPAEVGDFSSSAQAAGGPKESTDQTRTLF